MYSAPIRSFDKSMFNVQNQWLNQDIKVYVQFFLSLIRLNNLNVSRQKIYKDGIMFIETCNFEKISLYLR